MDSCFIPRHTTKRPCRFAPRMLLVTKSLSLKHSFNLHWNISQKWLCFLDPFPPYPQSMGAEDTLHDCFCVFTDYFFLSYSVSLLIQKHIYPYFVNCNLKIAFKSVYICSYRNSEGEKLFQWVVTPSRNQTFAVIYK